MNQYSSLQRKQQPKQRKRWSPSAGLFSFAGPTRLFAPVSDTSAPMYSSQGPVPRFRHSLESYSIEYKGAEPEPLRRKEAGEQTMSQGEAPLQLVRTLPVSHYIDHTVALGERLEDIANIYSVSVRELATLNTIPNSSDLCWSESHYSCSQRERQSARSDSSRRAFNVGQFNSSIDPSRAWRKSDAAGFK